MDVPSSSSKHTTAVVPKLNEEQIDNGKVQKFVLPPEYNEYDTRWTLKYREPAPGLVELMDNSGVYVSADKLAECEKWSNDYKAFARLLLTEIFTTSALSICSWTIDTTKSSVIHGGQARPGLDEHAKNILLMYVKQFGVFQNWNITDYQCCVNSMRQIMLEMRLDRQKEENYFDELMEKFSLTHFRQIMLEMIRGLQKEEEDVRDKLLGEDSQMCKWLLPPEYYDNDSRWTLKYHEPAPGLVELMPQSGVYVNADSLASSVCLSNDCVTLARNLLNGIFTTSALQTCSWTCPTSEDSDPGGTNVRPVLNEKAMTTLLNYVAEFELENDWIIKTDNKNAKNILQQKLKVLKPVENKEHASSSLAKLQEEMELEESNAITVGSSSYSKLQEEMELEESNAITVGSTSYSKDMVTELPKFNEGHTEQKDKQTDERKFVLFPECNKNDSRWTLKYLDPAPGLVELMEHSGVYVNAEKLAECKTQSKDCHKLTQMLLIEVFTANALSTCALPATLCKAFGCIVEHDIPKLDLHATKTLLKFIAEYALEEDWKLGDYGSILREIHRYSVMIRWFGAKKEHDRKRKILVPPEYDVHHSRWTLKYCEPAPGLVELMEHSGVYVNAEKLAECKTQSTDCHKLSQMLLIEIFTANALSTCALPAALCKAFGSIVEHDIPELDLHATKTLLMFIAEYALEKDWKEDDFGCILREIHRNNVIIRWFEVKKEYDRKRKIVFPPEYYDDSRWTLKYREPAPGLVQLIEHSRVYVNALKLTECKALSRDCVTLARRLVNEIFTSRALSACSVTYADAASDLDSVIANLRPRLDEHAMKILLKFVTEYGLEKDWKTKDHQFIQNCIRQKIEVMRYVEWNEENGKHIHNDELMKKLYSRWTVRDSIWTLVHRFPLQGVVELMERSGVYVDADNLTECKKLSNDCVTLALRLLTEVFKMSALRECSLSDKNLGIYETSPALNTHPHFQQESCELDAHAEIILLNFVDEYGLRMGWPLLDFRYIRERMLQKIQEIKREARSHLHFLKNLTDRWTLLYREPAPGIVELIENSGVYVSADKLAECKNTDSIEIIVSKLLYAVFTMYALGTCTLPAAMCNDVCIRMEPERPELDPHATETLLKFVEECGQKQGWKILDKRYVIALVHCRLEKERRR